MPIKFSKIANLQRFVGWHFLINALLFWFVGFGYLKSILLTSTLFKNSFVDFSSLLGSGFVLSFTLINYLSYMMLLAFFPALLIWLIMWIFPRKWFIWSVTVFVSSFSLLILLIDIHIYGLYKFHLNTTILSFIFNHDWREIFDLSRRERTFLYVVIVAVVCLQSLIAWLVWQQIVFKKRFYIGKSIATLWLGGACFSYFTLLLSMAQMNNLFSQQIPNLPFFSQLFVHMIPSAKAQSILEHYSEHHFSQPFFSNDKLRYPLHDLNCQPAKAQHNIILIMVDALRFDSLHASYMPYTAKFAERSWQFRQHWSAGNCTQPGLFSIFYSLPSNYWTATLKQQKPPALIDLLTKAGYNIRIVWSNEMHTPPFHKTVYQGIKHLDINGAPGNDLGDWDRYTTQQARLFLQQNHNQQPFFLNIFYNAPHGYCREQSFPQPFQPTQPVCSRIGMSNDINPRPYFNRYLNAVRFIDTQIAVILKDIENLGLLENSIVLITSDHGEEFNDNHKNYWGHTGNFSPAQIHVPLIIHWPGKQPKKVHYVTHSYDIVPTLLQDIFKCNNPVADYSVGQHLLQKEGRLPFLLAGSYINMGIVTPKCLTTLEASGRIKITDEHLEQIENVKPNSVHLKQALQLMRRYFET